MSVKWTVEIDDDGMVSCYSHGETDQIDPILSLAMILDDLSVTRNHFVLLIARLVTQVAEWSEEGEPDIFIRMYDAASKIVEADKTTAAK